MKLSATWLLFFVVGCGTNPPSEGGGRDVGSGGTSSSTAGSGGSSGAINVPIGGSSSAGTSSAAGTSALGGSGGGSAGSASGGGAGVSSGGAGGTSSAGTGGTASAGATSSGGAGSMLQTDITARFDNHAGADPVPALLGFLSVVNTAGGNAHLDLLKVRYYFTNEAPGLTFVLQNGFVQWPGNQTTVPVQGTVVKMADPKPTADSYLELTFQSTVILDAGKTALIDFRLFNTPSQQPILIQSNDYSFNLTPMVDTDKIVLLYRDVVIWGVEP